MTKEEEEVTTALTNMHGGKGKEHLDDLAAVVGSPEGLLADVLQGIEGKMEARAADDQPDPGESPRPGRVGMFASTRLVFCSQQYQSFKRNKYDFQIFPLVFKKMDYLSLLL